VETKSVRHSNIMIKYYLILLDVDLARTVNQQTAAEQEESSMLLFMQSWCCKSDFLVQINSGGLSEKLQKSKFTFICYVNTTAPQGIN
jgi:hypothetical protein